MPKIELREERIEELEGKIARSKEIFEQAFEEIDQFLHTYAGQWGVELDWGRNEDVLKAAGHTLDAEVRVADLSPRNQAEIKRIGFDLEAFPFEAESYVGNHLMKTVVFNTYLEDWKSRR